MNLVRSACLAVVLSVSSGSVATAQDFDKGFAAYDAGDFATAVDEFRPLAELGDKNAQHYLGVIYSSGLSVPQDYAEAIRWFRLAAEQGDAFSQDYLGIMYQAGIGVPQDDAEALRWYRLAAEQGLAIAQNALGFMYELGKGVPKDNVKAHMWYNIGAANGDALGGESRQNIADQMTPADISEAQAMARDCMSSGYADCGW
jgi:TPR repeat protein